MNQTVYSVHFSSVTKWHFLLTCWSRTPAFSRNGFSVSSSPLRSNPLVGLHPTWVTCLKFDGIPMSSLRSLPLALFLVGRWWGVIAAAAAGCCGNAAAVGAPTKQEKVSGIFFFRILGKFVTYRKACAAEWQYCQRHYFGSTLVGVAPAVDPSWYCSVWCDL